MKVSVALPTKKYDILIENNSLSDCGKWLSTIWPLNKKVAIITDDIVAPLYLKQVTDSLSTYGYTVISQSVPAGESSKSVEVAEQLFTWLAAEKVSRTDGILALGGGVVGDLAGFVASSYMRGLSFAQLPTSLLAQVDSSVGGKTAINCGGIKNLVGSFYQPDGVLIDPQTLKTLPDYRVSEGLAEIVKMAAILDKKLWQLLVELAGIEAFLVQPEGIIARCCQLKAQVVQEDEKETGKRLILNFGHTIAHGLEAVLPAGEMTHGQAVAIGMYQLSQMLSEDHAIPEEFIVELENLLSTFGLAVKLPEINVDQFINALNSDKKNRGKQIKLVYVKDLGQATVYTVPFEAFESKLRKRLSS